MILGRKGLIGLLILLGLGYFFYSKKNITLHRNLHKVKVKQTNFETPKYFKGHLMPSARVWYYAIFSSEIALRLENGVNVKEGEIVLKFDTEELEEKIKSHEEGVLDKQNVLSELLLQQKAEIEIEKLNIEEKELRYKLAMLNYEQAVSQPYADVRREQEILVQNAKLKKESVEVKHLANEKLYAKGLLTLKSLQSSKVNLIKSESDLLRVSIQVADKLKGVNTAQISRLKKEMDLAKSQYDDSIEGETRKKAIHELEKLRVEEEIKSIELKVERFKREYDTSFVKAPMDCKVYFPAVYKGSSSSQPIEIGETPIRGVGILYFTNSDDYNVHFHISETEFLDLEVGDALSFELRSNHEVSVEGSVQSFDTLAIDKNISLGSLALEQRGESGVQVVNVVGKLNQSHKDFRQGITGIVKTKMITKDKLAVPIHAVKVVEKKTFVEMNSGEIREVQLGINDGFNVEVISGLQLDEVVVYE